MPELVAITSAAVAVDDSLTTLIDWTNIELVSGFTLTVANAGGGSANDITDIQIDTSADGGTTVSLDQHAGVPAVPISTGKAAVGTFTESAAFVRVRAICAGGEDTTATAQLVATTSIGKLAALADIKDRLGIAATDTDNDQTIGRIITGITSIFEQHCRRPLVITAADVTEYLSGLGTRLQLNRYPVASITSLKIAIDYNFDDVTALVADTEYRLLTGGSTGILYRRGLTWPMIDDSIQVVYRGGYCPAGQTAGEGETALPADLREAAIEQSCFIFKRKDDIGLTSVSFDGGSIAKSSPMQLLPMVETILNRYRKPSL